MPERTRTAVEAAAACRCDVAQIVKSLVFRGRQSGKPFLLLVSGANRVDEEKAALHVGEPLARPDAHFVRDTTGYAIGGIPPFGHDVPVATYMDPDLLKFEVIWAAAGTPRTVIRLEPAALRDATGAKVIPMV
ncbi:MAG: YbaK/EbsC family protein, partial [Parvibaculaceae bacterium]